MFLSDAISMAVCAARLWHLVELIKINQNNLLLGNVPQDGVTWPPMNNLQLLLHKHFWKMRLFKIYQDISVQIY